MKFFYTALTTDNKKITGVLDTPDRESATGELHKMGVAILSVNDISEEEYVKFQKEEEENKTKKGIKTFQFLATDNFGKEIEGTIDSLDDYSAYKRLREEYQFKVGNLYVSTAMDDEKERAKTLIPGFEDQLRQQQAVTNKDVRLSAAKEEKLENEEDLNKEIVNEIDRVIINTKKALEQHSDLFSTDLILEIQATLGELERIRTSNNIKHITEVSNDLYALISSPDKVTPEMAKDENYQTLITEIHDSALVKKDFELYKKAVEASGLRRLFGDVAKNLKDMTVPKVDAEGKPVGFVSKLKLRVHNVLEKLTKKKAARKSQILKQRKPKSRLGLLIENAMAYFKATSPILKKTRQKELVNSFKSLFSRNKGAGEARAADGDKVESEDEDEKEGGESKGKKKAAAKKRKGRDFTGFFVEIDSFVGWLLCFYILYYFLVDFSLEKGIGLPREFVYRTLKTPLLVNITLFLVLAHFALRQRNLHLRGNTIASLFLLFSVVGVFLLLVVNF
jgi:hypothetical protein